MRNPSWREDLENSRDLKTGEKQGYGFLVAWFEEWRLARDLKPNRESAKRFWREAVMSKEREQWQLAQWTEAMRWYLNWLKLCQQNGQLVTSVGERMKQAMMQIGARRGLSYNRRKTYGAWVARYGASQRTARQAMDPANAREWLSHLVTEIKVAFATQKQALNALVFFFKEVCGLEEVELGVKMRKRQRHVPLVLSKSEVMRL